MNLQMSIRFHPRIIWVFLLEKRKKKETIKLNQRSESPPRNVYAAKVSLRSGLWSSFAIKITNSRLHIRINCIVCHDIWEGGYDSNGPVDGMKCNLKRCKKIDWQMKWTCVVLQYQESIKTNDDKKSW